MRGQASSRNGREERAGREGQGFGLRKGFPSVGVLLARAWALLLAAAVAATALVVAVVGAACLVGLLHGAREVCGDGVVGRPLRAAVHADARALQGGKRSAAKAAADEDVDPVFREQAREGAAPTTCEATTPPSSTSYSLKLCVRPKCWNTFPSS